MDTKLVEPLTEEQVRALLATCKTPKGATRERRFLDVRDDALIRLMVETGLRAGEVLALTVDDVRWKVNPPFLEVHKAKARRGRRVPFSAQAAIAVDRYARGATSTRPRGESCNVARGAWERPRVRGSV